MTPFWLRITATMLMAALWLMYAPGWVDAWGRATRTAVSERQLRLWRTLIWLRASIGTILALWAIDSIWRAH